MKKTAIVLGLVLLAIPLLGAQGNEPLVYHLIILDRTTVPNADINTGDINVSYMFRHGTNGYLIALYTTWGGPVFPQIPENVGIVTSIITTRRSTIQEYINSEAYRRFVTSRNVTSGIQRALAAPLPVRRPPVSTAAVPSSAFREIAYRQVQVGETRSLADAALDHRVDRWISSTPLTMSVDTNGNITGLRIGNGYIRINETEYISVAVVPPEGFYQLPDSQIAMLPEDSRIIDRSKSFINEYKTEPTFRLAFRFNNRGENRGASGPNGGIDILARGPNYEWLWTTFYQGGWIYDLNGVMREMVNGFQKDKNNGVELTLRPEFVYINGVPYLQLRHILRNPTNTVITGQRFGASADVMIHRNDHASLLHTHYGAYMTDSQDNPLLELMFICESGDGIDKVDTLWLGGYEEGHMDYIYEDRRSDVHGIDSAIGFSYQNIDLGPRESKEFVVRFTLARTEQVVEISGDTTSEDNSTASDNVGEIHEDGK